MNMMRINPQILADCFAANFQRNPIAACETTVPWIHVHAAAAHQSFQQDDVPFLHPEQNAKWSVVQKAGVLGMWGFLK